MLRIYDEQPSSPPGVWNRLEYRPLEGFVFAATPFNFTSIAGNLPTAPALMGNTVIWKPAQTAALSAHYVMEVLRAAGLPPGVINLVHGDGASIAAGILPRRHLAGIHFTGSTAVFQGMWQTVAANVGSYRNIPRIVGETGGKDFVLVHPSADVDAVVAAVVRGAFEYQGQKCSAASRLYTPRSLWPRLKERLQEEIAAIRMGDPAEPETFMGAVIDAKALARHRAAIADARAHPRAEVIAGGGTDDSVGWFVEPTLIETADADFPLLAEELFGPILTAYCYRDSEWEETLRLIDRTGPYGLTGAVFATERAAVDQALDALRYAAGNVYVNDKPTGAVVGQQPFGGARASGTNDKAGSLWNLARWTSPRAVKETLVPPTDWRYPFLAPGA
jgi:1-pyrroline-5-carboxylate dehydrogenase